MATPLAKVIRSLNLTDEFGKKGEVVITITPSGVELRAKGSQKRKLFINWKDLAKHTQLDPTMPAKYVGNKIGWLVE